MVASSPSEVPVREASPPVAPIRRVVMVVLDGLRPDAIPRFGLSHLTALARSGASTMCARTVMPSVTACAMASLLTGAAPSRHGLRSDRFHLPRPQGALDPLPRTLAAHGLPTSAFLAAMPPLFAGIAQRIASHAGVSHARFHGSDSHEILAQARPSLRDQRRGLILLHWPEGDRAGHADGWMSSGYEQAVYGMDVALGALVAEVAGDPSTLLIALADHGGGGKVIDHHDSDHPLDTTIPIILSGGGVQPQELAAGSSLLDIPATICWALGVPQPESFAGKPLALRLVPDTLAA